MCLNSNTHLNPFLLNQKDLESKAILPEIYCNMHIAFCNMHIATESILPLTHVDRQKQRGDWTKQDMTSPTVSTETVFITAVVNA